jgi:glucose-6-phosphate 1-dehydrogenase
MEPKIQADACTIVIFGASGDLTWRKLLPALHSLSCEGLLHRDTRVIGVARTALNSKTFHDRLYKGVLAYSRHKPKGDAMCALWPRFAEKIQYMHGDYDDPETYIRLKQVMEGSKTPPEQRRNALFYLATP